MVNQRSAMRALRPSACIVASVAGLRTARITPACTIVATVDNTAADTADRRRAGVCRANSPIAPMAAVLETKPAINPASGRPKRLPIIFCAM